MSTCNDGYELVHSWNRKRSYHLLVYMKRALYRLRFKVKNEITTYSNLILQSSKVIRVHLHQGTHPVSEISPFYGVCDLCSILITNRAESELNPSLNTINLLP